MMDVPDPQSISIAVFGFGAVGALTITLVVVNWLKNLLRWSGQRVRWLTTGVAAYVTGLLFASVYLPEVALGMGALFITALLATSADAFYQQAKSDGRRHDS